MTLKPIQGAPIGAPIPDFPTGTPAPPTASDSQPTRRPVAPLPFSLPPLERRSGPIEIRGSGSLTLTFRVIPEIPAIHRSSMIISIIGAPAEDHSPQTMPHLDLAMDEARAFLLALRDGAPSIVITDNRTAFQLQFAIAEDGPTFTISKPGQKHTAQRFNVGWSGDVNAMAAQLLADLGP